MIGQGLVTRRQLIQAAGAAVVAVGKSARTVPLELEIINEETSTLLPARVLIRDGDGLDYVPPATVEVPIIKDRWFVAKGKELLQVPAGALHIRVERGTEYVPVKRTLVVSQSAKQCKIHLRRWVDMRKRGYSCGEDHLHVPFHHLGAMLAAEGLDFGSSLYWWNGPHFDLPPGQGHVRTAQFGDFRMPVSVFDAEVEHAWGAVYLIGLSQPLRVRADPTHPNWAYITEARNDGGLVCYQGGWSPEVLVDALLGLVDVINVCNNNFHRYNFQPRSQYSNLLNVEGFPVYRDTPAGMMQMNTEPYYRLLNCGLRLAAGAGSATGVKTVPVGYNRTYVQAGPQPTLPQFLQAWREGRNFVTNGPMVFLHLEGDHQPGAALQLPAGGHRIHLKARAISEQPLRSLEILVNGVVVGGAHIAPESREAEVDFHWEASESCWIAARATEEDLFLDDQELSRYHSEIRDGSRTLQEEPCRLRFAHTSPIYVEAGGKPIRVGASLREARKMLDAFGGFAQREAKGKYGEEILDRLTEARRRLE